MINSSSLNHKETSIPHLSEWNRTGVGPSGLEADFVATRNQEWFRHLWCHLPFRLRGKNTDLLRNGWLVWHPIPPRSHSFLRPRLYITASAPITHCQRNRSQHEEEEDQTCTAKHGHGVQVQEDYMIHARSNTNTDIYCLSCTHSPREYLYKDRSPPPGPQKRGIRWLSYLTSPLFLPLNTPL